jgi:hypothetical protein
MEGLRGGGQTPKKSSESHKPTGRGKAHDKSLARKRAVIGRINAKIKTFKLSAHPYRNHHGRRLMGMTPICGGINFELRF